MDERLTTQNTLREMNETALRLNNCMSMISLIRQAEKQLEEVYDFYNARVYMADEAKNVIYRYHDNLQKLEYPRDIGHVGKCLNNHGSSSILYIENCRQHIDFNSAVDIDSQMPVVVVPIMYSKLNRETESIEKGMEY